MRSTTGHRDQRRSHHALQVQALARCVKCGTPKISHTTCENCGTYNNRAVIDVMKKLTKKERKQKAKELAAQERREHAAKPLDAQTLSSHA